MWSVSLKKKRELRFLDVIKSRFGIFYSIEVEQTEKKLTLARKRKYNEIQTKKSLWMTNDTNMIRRWWTNRGKKKKKKKIEQDKHFVRIGE